MTEPIDKLINRSNPSAHSSLESARLNSLVEKAKVLMDQLSAIAVRQTDAIESGDIEQIVEIVTKREPVVRGLVCVGEEIDAFISNPEAIALVNERERSKAFDRISSIEHAMRKLRERDVQDQKLMESTRDRLADELGSMGTGMSALRAYTTRSATPNPILQDRQG